MSKAKILLDEIIMFTTQVRGSGRGSGGPLQHDGGACNCVCPRCGQEVPHEKEMPCVDKQCPNCGTSMRGG